jgi:DNA-binding transcriptional MerR regulator
MSTNIVIENGAKIVETIRSAATSVLEAIDAPDHFELRDGLEHLRDTITEARQLGMPEAEIEKTLDEVRQLHPDVAETWSEILEQLEVSVWLQDPDGERVRGDTEIIDRIIWENWDDDEILEDVVYQLHADLEAEWEVVGVVSDLPASLPPPLVTSNANAAVVNPREAIQ